ncbi:hypothetical protein TNCV_532271 [Trichonephila clavipes]|nr:hypothetical protein TNCV_532271 [Trichonephila clavipes]
MLINTHSPNLETIVDNLSFSEKGDSMDGMYTDFAEGLNQSIGVDFHVDLVANSSNSLSSYTSPTTPDNALPLSQDPDGIFHPALH